MSKALPPLNTSQGHNNSYTAGTSGAYAGQSTGRSYSSHSRSMGPVRTVPKLPQIDFTLGPLQERTLPPYNDLEDPHLYPYWRRQESLAYARQTRREEQLRRERQEARQREASRRRFQERRRREREELAAKKGVRSETAQESEQPRRPARKTKAAGSARGSRRASERRHSADMYPTEADQYGQPAAGDEPSTADSDTDNDDQYKQREEAALWDHIEGFMAPEPAGVPLRSLPLMDDDDFVDLAEEHRKLSATDVKPTTRLNDLERAMNDQALHMAQQQNWEQREAFLGATIEGVPLRALPLDDHAEFMQLENTRRGLSGQSSPSRRQRIATVEGRMQEISHELAAAQNRATSPKAESDNDDNGDATGSDARSEGSSTHDSEGDADATTPLHATEVDKWVDREKYLGAYPEGVALRDIPLDDHEAFTTLEAERRHLLQVGGRDEHGAAIDKMEERLRDMCEEHARAIKAKESAVEDRYDDDNFDDDDEDDEKEEEAGQNQDRDPRAALGDDEDEKSPKTPQADHEQEKNASAASSKRSSASRNANVDDSKSAEFGADGEEKHREAKAEDKKSDSAQSTPHLTAQEEAHPVEKDAYEDDDFEDDNDKEDQEDTHATRDISDWRELGDGDEEKHREAKAEDEKSDSAQSTPHRTAQEEAHPVEKDAYEDDDFEDDNDKEDQEDTHATRDISDWRELGDGEIDQNKEAAPEHPALVTGEEQDPVAKDEYDDDDDFEAEDSDENEDDAKSRETPREAALEEEEKKSSAPSSKRTSESSVNADDKKWDELGDDEDDAQRAMAEADKSASAVSSKKSSVVESSKPSSPASSRRSSHSATTASESKATSKDKWEELGDDEGDVPPAKKASSRASSPVSSKADGAYGEDKDWDEM